MLLDVVEGTVLGVDDHRRVAGLEAIQGLAVRLSAVRDEMKSRHAERHVVVEPGVEQVAVAPHVADQVHRGGRVLGPARIAPADRGRAAGEEIANDTYGRAPRSARPAHQEDTRGAAW